MYFHASEFRGRLTFALLLEGNYVCSFPLVKRRGKYFLRVYMRERGQVTSLRLKKEYQI